GKEGGSGGWSHLHFEIKSRQPSGLWGTQEAYAFLWQSYHDQYKPAVTAVARPHVLAAPGEQVVLDGTRSRDLQNRDLKLEWQLSNGERKEGTTVIRTYSEPGMYSEILKATNPDGEFDYDFAVVQIVDPKTPEDLPPSIHAAFAPTWNLRPGMPITFKVRSFRAGPGAEVWDFGDGSHPVTVHSDGNKEQLNPDGYAVIEHSFDKPGDYLVRVERKDPKGRTATAHLHVRITE
ncbi:MAG TPA: PKD domain-containing protein, partial [Acidobacteriota bacterium]|nr:PKD domain-containing protein [Acidobacteriota bacterium]